MSNKLRFFLLVGLLLALALVAIFYVWYDSTPKDITETKSENIVQDNELMEDESVSGEDDSSNEGVNESAPEDNSSSSDTMGSEESNEQESNESEETSNVVEENEVVEENNGGNMENNPPPSIEEGPVQPPPESSSQNNNLAEFAMNSFTEVVSGEFFPQFSKKELIANKGDTVIITVIATSGNHDFNIDEFGIHEETPVGQQVTVEFVADEVGEFYYYCNKPGHRAKGHWGILKVLE